MPIFSGLILFVTDVDLIIGLNWAAEDNWVASQENLSSGFPTRSDTIRVIQPEAGNFRLRKKRDCTMYRKQRR